MQILYECTSGKNRQIEGRWEGGDRKGDGEGGELEEEGEEDEEAEAKESDEETYVRSRKKWRGHENHAIA